MVLSMQTASVVCLHSDSLDILENVEHRCLNTIIIHLATPSSTPSLLQKPLFVADDNDNDYDDRCLCLFPNEEALSSASSCARRCVLISSSTARASKRFWSSTITSYVMCFTLQKRLRYIDSSPGRLWEGEPSRRFDPLCCSGSHHSSPLYE